MRRAEASALNNIAMMYLRRDRETEAKQWLIKAIDAAHAGDIIGEEAPALFHLGLIRADEGDYELAQASVEQALKLYERAGDQDGISRCRDCLDALIEAQRWKHRNKVLDSLFEDYKKSPAPTRACSPRRRLPHPFKPTQSSSCLTGRG